MPHLGRTTSHPCSHCNKCAFRPDKRSKCPCIDQSLLGSSEEFKVEPRAKIKRDIFKEEFPNVYNLERQFFSDPDGEIIFSNNSDLFSYSIDYVSENKYDFVTVALQELAKILGFYFDVTASNIDKQLKIDKNNLTRFDWLVLPYNYHNNPSGAYTYATSGNVSVYFGDISKPYKMYAPSTFESKRSLSFFAKDNANIETRLMQPDLPRGTSIRYIGKGLKDMLESAKWLKYYPVGMGGELHEAGSASTDAAVDYNQSVSFGTNGSRSYIAGNPRLSAPPAARIISGVPQNGTSSEWIQSYLDQLKNYPNINIDKNYPTVGWSVSILRKDGTWEVLTTAPDIMSKIDFSTSMISPAKAKDYARSSDGYLRCRISYNDGIGYNLHYQSKSFSRYFLLDYLPQAPEMAFAKVMNTMLASTGDDYSVDIKVAFKNVEGTEKILVEQLDEGESVPFTYYVKNVKDGYFIANVDKEYKTTFRLKAVNKNGVTLSDYLIVSPVGKPVLKFDPRIGDNVLILNFKDNMGNLVEYKNVTSYQISNLMNPTIYKQGKATDNRIDVSSLPSGVYGIQVVDEQSNVYNAKIIK